MKLLLYLFLCTIKKRIRNILKNLIFRPDEIQVSINLILKKIDVSKINYFIQIGSNDGIKNDPLHQFILENDLKGIVIEPFKANFDKLVNTYSNRKDKIIFANVGISDFPGTYNFYYVKDIQNDEPGWFDQIGSFDQETFLKNIAPIPALNDRIGIEKISVKTFSQVLEENNISNVELVHIDAEGYDFRIIKSIDFTKWNPLIILFEIEWMTLYEIKEIKKMLLRHGYKIYSSGIDIIAIKLKYYIKYI